MPNTYTQIHLQLVFAVKYRDAVINPSWQDELYRYITGIVQHQQHKLLAIGGMPDHIHILIGLRPTQAISDLLQDIKANSSKWINERGFTKGRFSWQEGYGAFSYSKRDVPAVIKYIRNQESHHQQKTFTDEYRELLKTFEVEFDERYILRSPMD
ncbi:MAG: IS200/IS605 family transposase [Cyclobacteriaceae bacterium]|jgi:REP element-mobilizing transposase RayT|nr:IS200/IS605 family transposase [Cyclobacteriaceae bacterium]